MARYLLSLFALVASTSAASTFRSFKAADVSSTPKALPNAQFSVPLTHKSPRSASKKNLLAQLTSHRRTTDSASLDGGDDDEEYLATITVGGQDFLVIFDTGSSDTWVVQQGFNCLDLSGSPQSESECNFGSPLFNPNTSSTYQVIPNENLNVTYGDEEFVLGPVAYESVSVGGLEVTKQLIGAVNTAGWLGDGVSAGTLGLAFPDLTSAYSGTDPYKDVVGDIDVYDPFFITALKEGAVTNPYFSVALNRGSLANQSNSTLDQNLGQVAFGGIVDVPVTANAVTLPVQGFSAPFTNNTKEYVWYVVDVEGYNFPGAPPVTEAGKQAIVDTGTTLTYVPTPIMAALGEAFVPPAVNSSDYAAFVVQCNATAPVFSVTLGGKNFTVDPKDLITPVGFDASGDLVCFSGVQDGGSPANDQNIFTLGMTFLHNVVTTFNVQSPSVTITQREAY